MAKRNEIKEAIDQLSCDSIECKPIHIDWSERRGGDGDSWHAFEAAECDKCGAVLVLDCDGDQQHRDLVNDSQCDGFVSAAEGPMMNYWYPVEIANCEDAARQLANLPLCVVEFDDGETGLALTGGGMDLSWEICDAFVTLGKMPPSHFSDLPGMAGKKLDKRNRLIIEACIASNEVVKRWADSRIDRIKRTVSQLRKDARKKRTS